MSGQIEDFEIKQKIRIGKIYWSYYTLARREGTEGVTVREHRGDRGSELPGLECKIHPLKLRPANVMMFFLFRAEIRTSADAITLF